jgi:hypothetical protein
MLQVEKSFNFDSHVRGRETVEDLCANDALLDYFVP